MKKFFLPILSFLLVITLFAGCDNTAGGDEYDGVEGTQKSAESTDGLLTLDVEYIGPWSEQKGNVCYTAKLNIVTIAPVRQKIDFFTGSPWLTVFPNDYLGSAYIDSTGVARLYVEQLPGQYAGGATCYIGQSVQKTFSNVVIYKVYR